MGYEYYNTILFWGGFFIMDTRKSTTEMNKKLDFMKMMFRMNTSIPAIVDEFDVGTQRVSATPAIMYKHILPDGKVEYINYPKITNIPLAIQRGNGVCITYPIIKGDKCTLIFSQRSIDNFLLEGDIQKPYEGENSITSVIRCMDMTDAMCFPGIITNKDFISNYSTSAVEIRNATGDTKVSVASNSLTLIQGSATIALSGGNINISASSVTINGKDWDTHKHKNGTASDGNTGVIV